MNALLPPPDDNFYNWISMQKPSHYPALALEALLIHYHTTVLKNRKYEWSLSWREAQATYEEDMVDVESKVRAMEMGPITLAEIKWLKENSKNLFT